MKNVLFLFVTLLFVTLPAVAQSSHVGLMMGRAESIEDGFEFDLDNSIREIFFATEVEPGTLFKLKAGQLDVEAAGLIADATGDAKIEYVDVLVEYRFWEVFGSTGMFAGPGFYRQSQDDSGLEESDYGLTFGVNGLFPITRRIGLLAEVGYHWVHFEQNYSFVNASAGIRLSF